MIYIPSLLNVNGFQKTILLIVQYKYVKTLRDLFSRIWSSAQDHAILVVLLNLVGCFISVRPKRAGGNVLHLWGTSFEVACRGDQPLNILAWFIGLDGHDGAHFAKFRDNLEISFVDSSYEWKSTVLRISDLPGRNLAIRPEWKKSFRKFLNQKQWNFQSKIWGIEK